MHKRRRVQFSTKMVIASATAIVAYTAALLGIAVFALMNHMMPNYPPDALTAAWYAFWTVELISLTTIKRSKIKNKYERNDADEQQ